MFGGMLAASRGWPRGWRAGALAACVAGVCAWLLLASSAAYASGVPFRTGDVLVGVGNGLIYHFDPSGNLLDTLDTTSGSSEDTGMCFDSHGNMYATSFEANSMSKFDTNGNLLIASFGSGFNMHPESCSFNTSDQIYVGQADGSANILQFDTSGNLLNTFAPTRENRGTDWTELLQDQCTAQYTSEGPSILQFNVCTNTQMANFANANLPAPCYAHRALADGTVLVACSSVVERVNSSGNVIQTYNPPGASTLFALNLDPDGTSFWTADIFSKQIWRMDIATGNVISTWNANAPVDVAGLAVVGELTSGTPSVTVSPNSQSQTTGSPATLTATLTQGGAPLNGQTILWSVSGVNSASGTSTTNASGQATFSYTGTNTGNDTVTACYDANNNGVCDPSESTGTATVTWTSGGTDPLISIQGTTTTVRTCARDELTLATFTDPDPSARDSEYTVMIDWGDGTSSPGHITKQNGVFYVHARHCYLRMGRYTVTVTVTDPDGPTEPTATSLIIVRDRRDRPGGSPPLLLQMVLRQAGKAHHQRAHHHARHHARKAQRTHKR